MRWTLGAFKVAAWMLLRDLMKARGLSEEWLREQSGDQRATLDSWLRSAAHHRVGDYCDLILKAEETPPRPEAEPFDAGFADLFRNVEFRSDLPPAEVAEVTARSDPDDPRLLLLDLALRGVLEDVRQDRRSSSEVISTLRRYIERLSTDDR